MSTEPSLTLLSTLDGHKGPVHVVRYSQGDAKYALTGSQDRTIKLWNHQLGSEVKTYKGHGYEVLSIAVAPGNAAFASSGGDRSAFVWDVTTGQTIKRFSGHQGRINAVEFNSDASVLASGSFDSSVRLWDMKAQSRQAIQILDDARDSISTIHITSTEIITGSVDGYVRSYDLRKGGLTSDYLGQPVTSVLPTADSQTLLVTTLDSTVRLMDRSNGTMLNSFKGHVNESYRTRACLGHGEASVLCGDEEGRLWAWDLLSAESIMGKGPPKQIHDKVITWVEHHPREHTLMTASADGKVKVWRMPAAPK